VKGVPASVPVLLYHHVNPHEGDLVTVTPDVFREQMAWLVAAGYESLSLGELLAFMAGSLRLTRPAVVLTFDDGWLDNYQYAFPVLREFGLRGSFFLITARTAAATAAHNSAPGALPDHEGAKQAIRQGEAGRVVIGWETAREMHRSGLAGFYPHSHTHPRCADLPRDEVMHELLHSRALLAANLGVAADCFCWPYGSIPAEGESWGRDAGYTALLTTAAGVARPGGNPFAIPRLDPGTSVHSLREVLVGSGWAGPA